IAVRLHEALGNFDRAVETAREPVIPLRPEARAGAMLAVSVNDKALARHDVEHAFDQRLRYERRFPRPAVLRPAALMLRPKSVKDKCIGPPVPAMTLWLVRALAQRRAIGRAPRQNECVVVESARHIAFPVAGVVRR